MALFVLFVLPGCASLPVQEDNTPKRFDLIVASEDQILDTVYDVMLDLFPNDIFFQNQGSDPGYSWQPRVYWEHSFSYPLPIGHRDRHEYDYWVSGPGQFNFTIKESLGLTDSGSIIMGYRYSIWSFNGIYINDDTHAHYLDLLFRDELFKRGITKLSVSQVK